METIILISGYLLSVFITRYAFIKINLIDYISMFISFIPIINLFFSLVCLFIYVDENYDIKIEKITDWFFGKKD